MGHGRGEGAKPVLKVEELMGTRAQIYLHPRGPQVGPASLLRGWRPAPELSGGPLIS